ncbi:type II toxin-antitoxin system PemK/MazF family toxin [Lactococcus insecticola]|uniref:mRNA interferase n=1 Tax=Pseudolactococcus insecticola TaxID=2709158 RepID=A0A6A0B610_9LACT|nr:type II toxin-antitoxin system PemK/MazF family toxin [Lactococcus insecticola]GFH39724.1 mRNA interferase [Lactococcus insecticola]
MVKEITRGDIFFADLSPVTGSEQGGVRPVLIIQNDAGNTFAPTTIIAAITAKKTKKALPTHVAIKKEDAGVGSDSVILCEQVRTIDKVRLREKTGHLSPDIMKKVNLAIKKSLSI